MFAISNLVLYYLEPVLLKKVPYLELFRTMQDQVQPKFVIVHTLCVGYNKAANLFVVPNLVVYSFKPMLPKKVPYLVLYINIGIMQDQVQPKFGTMQTL